MKKGMLDMMFEILEKLRWPSFERVDKPEDMFVKVEADMPDYDIEIIVKPRVRNMP